MKKQKGVDKKVFSFFIIGFPVILAVFLVMIPEFYWLVAIGIIFYQLVLLKQFLDNYYVI